MPIKIVQNQYAKKDGSERMDIKAKIRPFHIAKMLYEQTDEEHYLTIAQILDQLKNEY